MFRSIIASYYRGAHGVLLMFDLTRRSTFNSLASWLDEVTLKAPEDVPLVLVGNKCDLPGREVPAAEAAEFAQQHGMLYLETSAKSDAGVADAFITLIACAVGRRDEASALLHTARVTQVNALGPGGVPRPGGDSGSIALSGGMDSHPQQAPKGKKKGGDDEDGETKQYPPALFGPNASQGQQFAVTVSLAEKLVWQKS